MKMRKLFASLAVGALLCFGCAGVAFAQTNSVDWAVSFSNDAQMVSDYDQQAVNDALSAMQPGDSVKFEVTVTNDNENSTDWYMTNQVIKALEDEDLEYGGAYTYSLSYGDRVLYSSDMIGGEGSGGATGLQEATEATGEWLYLATLGQGESGTVVLEVSLDGSTQGNAYMNKLGTLQINFAVEYTDNGHTELVYRPGDPTPGEQIKDNANPLDTWVPRTGDLITGGLTLIAIAAGVCFFAMGLRRLRKGSR